MMQEDLAAAEAELAGWYETMQRETNALKRIYHSPDHDVTHSLHGTGLPDSSKVSPGPAPHEKISPRAGSQEGNISPRSRVFERSSLSPKKRVGLSDSTNTAGQVAEADDTDYRARVRRRMLHVKQSPEQIAARQLPQVTACKAFVLC